MPLTPCRACRQLRSSLRMRRNLCRRCFGRHDVRALHPHGGTCLLGLGTQDPRCRDFAGPAPPPEPCAVPPGPAKLPVLAARAARGEALFPPPDPRRGPAEPCLPLAEKALPYGVKFPEVWRVLALLCPELIDYLTPP